MKAVVILLLFSLAGTGRAGEASPWKQLADPKTKITYYVEADRKHIAARNVEGKLLWRICPESSLLLVKARPGYSENGIPKETITPYIRLFEFIPPERWKFYQPHREGNGEDFIEIGFKPNQGGLIRKSDGHFFYLGSN